MIRKKPCLWVLFVEFRAKREPRYTWSPGIEAFRLLRDARRMATAHRTAKWAKRQGMELVKLKIARYEQA